MMENGRIAKREFENRFPQLNWLQLLELNENGEGLRSFLRNAWSMNLTSSHMFLFLSVAEDTLHDDYDRAMLNVDFDQL